MNKLIILVLSGVLAGCSTAGPDAPSLLPRPIESRSDDEPTSVPAPVPADPALDRQIAERIAAFNASIATFDSVATRAERYAGQTARPAVGSDAWLEAQATVGELDQALSASEAALADLEAMAITRASEGQPPYLALDTAIETAQTASQRAMATSERLKSRLAD